MRENPALWGKSPESTLLKGSEAEGIVLICAIHF